MPNEWLRNLATKPAGVVRRLRTCTKSAIAYGDAYLGVPVQAG